MLAVVVAAVVHFAEARAFVGLVERSQPSWLAVAVLLQILTYVAQGEVFLAAPHASGHAVPRRLVYELSLTKLFLDQAVPSAGLASTAIVANALERQGIPRALTAAGAILNIASYHLSYVLLLLGALGVVFALGAMNALVAAISLLFIAFAVAFAGLVLGLAGRASTGAGPTARIPGLKGIATFLAAADTRLARHPGLLLKTGGWQAAIFLLDAFTMWSLIHAVGAAAPATAVFAAFMVASVFRTVSVSPGGLGAYEAASVLTLKMVGVSLPVALATTLLFRGLSFWAPMLPGLWCSRRLLREKKPEQAEPATPEYWSIPGELVAAQLQSGPDGLPAREAAARLVRYGPNALEASRSRTWLHVLANQLRSPLLLLLVFAALASGLTQEWFDASMVLVIVITTVVIGFAREYSAETAAQALRARVRVRARAVRDGRLDEVDAVAIVPGTWSNWPPAA
jgi:Mg2+-importing ATPase